MEQLKSVLEIIRLGEGLKRELRHSWLSNGRQESVAEHTWRLALMAMAIEPHLPQKVDSERLLKMIIIHDLVEVYAKDVPAFDTMNNPAAKTQKRTKEEAAMEKICHLMGEESGRYFHDLWLEFEEKQTYEAKVANALDKLEAQQQHNEAALATWLPVEHEMTFMLDKHTDFDPVLSALKDLIEAEGKKKLLDAGIDTAHMKKARC